MGYTLDDWSKRIAERSDMTSGLTHLTRQNERMDVLDVLMKILNERCIKGSSPETGFIVGDCRAVCFQDVPMFSLAQNIYTEQKYRKDNKITKERYAPLGLQFHKKYVFNNGGRPVIYEKTEDAKSLLPYSEWWRIVNFDLSDEERIVDWSHEREWRVPGDFNFELSNVSVILSNTKAYREFINRCLTDNIEILKNIRGITQLGLVFH
jgi:hypothetical protein